MTFWILYLAAGTTFNVQHPYHFAFQNTCDKIGKVMVKDYMYKKYKCVKTILK